MRGGRAFVVLFEDAPELSGNEILTRLREGLATYKLRTRVEVVAELPRTTGKIQKNVLRERA